MKMDTSGSLPVISLFCGAGGLDTGFRRQGFIPVLAVDHNPAACETVKRNHPDTQVVRADLGSVDAKFLEARLSELPYPPHPVGVIGGPPCQAFSLSNGHKKENDPRAELSVRYARLLRSLNERFALRFFVFENVMGLGHQRHSREWNELKALFGEAGFWIFEDVLDAKFFGVAQERKRIFIVGFNKNLYPLVDFEFPTPGNRIKTVRRAIGGLPPPKHFDRSLQRKDIPFHPNHWCMKPKSHRFSNGDLREGDVKGELLGF